MIVRAPKREWRPVLELEQPMGIAAFSLLDRFHAHIVLEVIVPPYNHRGCGA